MPAQPETGTDLLQRFLPRELLVKLETARRDQRLVGERRVVTILFCDVKGSTAAAANLDPEDWAEIINGAFEHMIRPIYRYEGTVARLMGDGLLAFFGAPIAHEDDPQRAILAGLDILEAVRSFAVGVKARWNLDFEVRVGINTGLVVVGAVGSDLRVEYTALGDAINLAARMEQTAQPGTVQIAETTYKLVAPLFDFEPITELEVKGRPETITAFRVLAPKVQPGSLRGLTGLQSPLIGRAEQMAALWTAASGLTEGRGKIVSVIGEAGLGKSRLVTEFRRAALADPDLNLQWLEARSLSYEINTPFAPVKDLFRHFFNLKADLPTEHAYNRITDQLESLFPENSQAMAPFFASLLDLPLSGEAAERIKYLEPPMLRMQIFTQVAALLAQMAASRPLVIFLDDLHWTDPTSLDLIHSLLPLVERLPLLIIAAFRPRQQEPSWQFHETASRNFPYRYQLITLQPLDETQARQLVANLLEIEDLPEKVRQLILDKSEGNPFFVEEVIRSLLDGGLVIRQDGHWRATRQVINIKIPDTLVGVITARLDRLDDLTRRTIQTASVLGREFSLDILTAMADNPALLEGHLAELQRRELIREKSRSPELNYAFKHILTQEAAYNSMLLSIRRELHHRAAEALIFRHPDQAAAIARHLLEARLPGRALPYLVAAGDQANRAYATAEAIDFYQQALELRQSAESLESVQRAYEGLGRAFTFASRIPEAQKVYQEMLMLAENAENVPMEISALNKLAGISALYTGQFQLAEGYLARAESLARQHNEKSSIPETSLLRCQMCTARADFDSVVSVMGEVVEIGQELGNQEFIALGLDHISSSLLFMTRYDEALGKAHRALQIARQIGNREVEASLLSSTLPACYIRIGDFLAARQALLEGLEIATRIGSLFSQTWAAWSLADLLRLQGEYEAALHYGQAAIETALPLEPFMPFLVVPPLGTLGSIYLDISEQFKDKINQLHQHALRLLESPAATMSGGTAWADLGFCALAQGNLSLAGEVFDKGLHIPTMFTLVEQPRLLAGAALLACVQGEFDQALRMAQDAHTFATERCMRHILPLTWLTLGKIRVARGELESSLEAFVEAELAAMTLGLRPWAWQIMAAAGNALAEAGQNKPAHEKRNAAQALVIEIADQISDPDLRNAYQRSTLAKIWG
jgi:class 3 adenylate cyclase/tetratricopeptide (TPR) repeat protein